MKHVKSIKHPNPLGQIEMPAITIEESANHLDVSAATIRNWIKTKYLEQTAKGKVTLESVKQFQSEISGREN